MTATTAWVTAVPRDLLPLDDAIPGQPGRFRHVLRLRLATGGAATGLRFDPAPAFGYRFLDRTIDATDAGAPLQATLDTTDGDLLVSLPRAANIRRVSLTDPTSTDAVLAYRVDGSAIGDEPVRDVRYLGLGARLDIDAQSLVLRLRRDGVERPLLADEIAAIRVRAPATLPRLAVAVVGDPAGFQPLPPETDDDGNPRFPVLGDRGQALTAAIERSLSRWQADGGPATLPDPLEIDVAFEADAPCLAGPRDVTFPFTLERPLLVEGAGKQVLRISPTPAPHPLVAVALPPAGFTIAAPFSLAVGGLGAAPASARPVAAALDAPVSQDGLAVRGSAAAAMCMPLDGAQVVDGAGLHVAGLGGPCRFSIAVWQADAAGLPGERVTGSLAVVAPPGAPTRHAAPFETATVLDGAACWVGIEVLSGACLLALSETGPGVAMRADGRWTEPGHLAGRGAVVDLLSPPGTAGTQPAPPVSVTLDGVAVPLATTEDTLDGDLAAAILTGAATGTAGQLEIAGPAGAVVTLRPGVLRYRLSS